MAALPPDLDPIQRLRQAQLDRGISLEALASRIGISPRKMKRLYGRERGRGKEFRESVEILAALRSALGLRWDEIFPED